MGGMKRKMERFDAPFYDAFWADLEKRLAAVPVTAERREVPCADKAARTGAAKVRLNNCEGVQVDESVRN